MGIEQPDLSSTFEFNVQGGMGVQPIVDVLGANRSDGIKGELVPLERENGATNAVNLVDGGVVFQSISGFNRD
ncbi:MAG: hypothetical protein ACLQAH_05285 [Limisphaerales bacterium]